MYNNRYKKASSKIAKRRHVRETLALVLKITIPAVFLFCVVWFLRADFLQVKDFEISGAQTVSADDLKNTVQNLTLGNNFFVIPKTNIFFLNKDKLAAVLLSDFPRIEKVVINKNLFSQNIKLQIVERESDFLWCRDQNECFNMTKNGLVFERTSEISGKIIFTGVLTGDPLMKNFATSDAMQNYLKFAEEFKKVGFDITAIYIETNDRAIAKINIQGTDSDVIFNPTEGDFVLVAQNTILLIKETLAKNPTARFNYIDARFDNKFFYKVY